jgi:lysine-specific demethylase 3
VVSVVDNVSRCQQLTSDFRNENFVNAWKEDVLQLYNVLWYAWLSSREARDRRIQEEEEKRKVEEARQKHLKSLQDGATHHSPGRSHFWAMSSVRDEEPLREGSVSSRASPAPIPLGRGSADVPISVPAAVSPLAGRTDAPTNGTSGTGGETPERGAAAAVVEDEALEKKQKLEGPPVDMKQTLALRLLSASLSAPDAPPPPAPRNPSAGSKVPIKRFPSASATTPGSPRVKLEPTRSLRSGSDMGTAGTTEVTRMRDAIKRGHIGVDLMVSVARAEMGLGADRDVDGDGDVEMNMEGMWGDVAQSAQMQLEQREAENEENGKGNAEEVSEGGDEGDDGDAAFTEATREALLKVVAPLQNSGDDDEEMEEDTALAGEGAGELVTAEESEIQ